MDGDAESIDIVYGSERGALFQGGDDADDAVSRSALGTPGSTAALLRDMHAALRARGGLGGPRQDQQLSKRQRLLLAAQQQKQAMQARRQQGLQPGHGAMPLDTVTPPLHHRTTTTDAQEPDLTPRMPDGAPGQDQHHHHAARPPPPHPSSRGSLTRQAAPMVLVVDDVLESSPEVLEMEMERMSLEQLQELQQRLSSRGGLLGG